MTQLPSAAEIGAAAAAVRHALLNPADYSGPRDPKRPVSLSELGFGGECVGYDPRVDATMRIDLLLRTHGFTDSVAACLWAAQQSPTDRNLRRARTTARRAVERDKEPRELHRSLLGLAAALTHLLARLGDSVCAAEIAAGALDRAMSAVGAGQYVEAALLFRVACYWADDAQATGEPLAAEPIYPQLSALDGMAQAWLATFVIYTEAEHGLAIEEALLRPGAAAGLDERALSEGFASLARIRSLPDGEPVRVPAAPRGLVVVPDLGHLPKPSTTSQERRDSPRAEFERIAGKVLPLRPAPDPHAFVEAGAARAPWMRPVFETLAQDLVGAPYAWIRPTAFVGPPGGGKTAAVRAVAAGLGMQLTLYNAAGMSDGSIGGTSRQWGTGRASVPAQLLLRIAMANGIIAIDELEKASSDRRNGALGDALLPFLERESAKAVFDPYLECPVNLSAITYLATANGVDGIPGPLRDRFRIIRVPMPRAEDLPVVAANIVAEVRADRGLDAAWLPDLEPDELHLLSRHWRGGSLRPLRRLVETILAGRDRSAPRH